MTGPPPPAKRDVDVVLLTHNNREMLLTAVDRAGRCPAVASVVVVDNASTDGTAELVRERTTATVVRLDTHHGLSAALNRGADVGHAEFVLFLNDDVFAREGAIAALREAMRSRPSVVSCGGRLVDPGTHATQRRYLPKRFPTWSSMALRLSGLDRLWSDSGGMAPDAPLPPDSARVPVAQPAGAVLMVRRSALETIGGWDEGYWFWMEDVDLSLRLSRLGEALFVGEAEFEHLGGVTVGRWDRVEAHRRTYHGVFRYATTHLSRGQRAALGVCMVPSVLTRWALAGRHPEARAVYGQAVRGALGLVVGRRSSAG